MSKKPILLKEFDLRLKKIAKFENQPHIGLSLSGGSDSLSLMFLLKKWVDSKSGKLTAFVVDHGIRGNSHQESRIVEKIAQKNNIDCKVLKWIGPKPLSKLMQIARDERFKLIKKECLHKQILHLMVAHHFDDLIETFFMRSKRIGNIIGLASIPQIRESQNFRIIRPLLGFRKKRLIETCKYFDSKWLEDPSNKNMKFERIRIRKQLCLEANNLDYDNYKSKINFFIKKRCFYEDILSNFFIRYLEFELFGQFKINRKIFFKQKKDIQIEIFKRILTTNSGKEYPPKKKSVENVIDKIQNNLNSKLTLYSNIIKSNREKILFSREPKKTIEFAGKGISIKIGTNFLWDNRFLLSSNKCRLNCESIKLENWEFIRSKFFESKKKKLSFELLQTLPLIRIEKEYLIPYITDKVIMKNFGIRFDFFPKIPITHNKFLIIN